MDCDQDPDCRCKIKIQIKIQINISQRTYYVHSQVTVPRRGPFEHCLKRSFLCGQGVCALQLGGGDGSLHVSLTPEELRVEVGSGWSTGVRPKVPG